MDNKTALKIASHVKKLYTAATIDFKCSGVDGEIEPRERGIEIGKLYAYGTAYNVICCLISDDRLESHRMIEDYEVAQHLNLKEDPCSILGAIKYQLSYAEGRLFLSRIDNRTGDTSE